MIEGLRITFVVAVARNGVIGAAGGLPWRLPSDLKRFKALTLGHPVIMGRKTFQSIGRPLPGRDNIVVTRRGDLGIAGIECVPTVEAALSLAASRAQARRVADIMVIGGGEIYAGLLARADRIHLTRVDLDAAGDTRFPALDAAEWHEVAREVVAPGPGDSAAFTVLVLDRSRPA